MTVVFASEDRVRQGSPMEHSSSLPSFVIEASKARGH